MVHDSLRTLITTSSPSRKLAIPIPSPPPLTHTYTHTDYLRNCGYVLVGWRWQIVWVPHIVPFTFACYSNYAFVLLVVDVASISGVGLLGTLVVRGWHHLVLKAVVSKCCVGWSMLP